jgi:ABC-type transport system involved in cytochrome bd biosynthesis fused ATPase/permease subunit
MKKPFISVLGNTEYQKWRKLWLLRGVDGVLTIAPLIMIAVALLYIETGGVSHINKLLFLGASYIAIMILRKCIIWHTNLRLNQIAFNYGLEQRRSTLEHLLSISSENFSKLHRGSISQALSDDLLWVETWFSFTVPILLVDAVSIAPIWGNF